MRSNNKLNSNRLPVKMKLKRSYSTTWQISYHVKTTKTTSRHKKAKHKENKNTYGIFLYETVTKNRLSLTLATFYVSLHFNQHCVVGLCNSVELYLALNDTREWVSSVLRPLQHSIGYTGDGFYRSKDPTNSIKVLKEMLQNTKKTTKTTKDRYT